jgi:hypothetical protein
VTGDAAADGVEELAALDIGRMGGEIRGHERRWFGQNKKDTATEQA